MAADEISQYNIRHAGYSMIVTSSTQSHFMSGETMAVFLEQLYSKAFQIQRAKQLGFNLYPEEINVEPNDEVLEYDFPFQLGDCQVPC